jgi:copper resistance protein C
VRRLRCAAALALLCAALPAGAWLALARAHATLDHSTPTAGATVATAPRQVDLYFAESIADAGGQTFAVVLDSAGRTVSVSAQGDSADPRHLIVPLSGALDAGSYTVFWKSISANDGGATLGDFPFTVGSVAATPATLAGQVPVPDTLRARALSSGGSGGTAWLLGGALGAVLGCSLTAALFVARARRQERHAATRRSAGKRR